MVKVCKCTQNPQADEHALGITTCLLVKKEKCFKTFSSASLPLQNVHIHQHEWHSQHKLSSTLPTDRARRPTLLNYWTLVRTYLALNLLFYFPGVCSPVQQYGSLKAKRHFWTQRNMRTITIWFIESKQFQTLLFGLIFLLFFLVFWYLSSFAQELHEEGLMTVNDLLGQFLVCIFGGHYFLEQRKVICLPTNNFSFASRTLTLGRSF